MERRRPRRDGLQRDVLVPKKLVTWANKKIAAPKTSSLGLARAVAAVKRQVRGFRKTARSRVGFVGAQHEWHVAKEAEQLVPGPFVTVVPRVLICAARRHCHVGQCVQGRKVTMVLRHSQSADPDCLNRVYPI